MNLSADLRSRLLFTLVALVGYRLGAAVPLPGVDIDAVAYAFRAGWSRWNWFTNAATSYSLFALGLQPYMSAFVCVQVFAWLVPGVGASRDTPRGRRRLARSTLVATVLLALFQSLGIVAGLQAGAKLEAGAGLSGAATAMLSLTAGAVVLAWLGEQISERGIGNGIVVLLAAGIVAALPGSLLLLFERLREGSLSGYAALGFAACVLAQAALIVLIESARRRVPVAFAGPVNAAAAGSRSMGLALVLPLNAAGVLPPIFAYTALPLLLLVVEIGAGALSGRELELDRSLYLALSAILIAAAVFACAGAAFDPDERAEAIAKAGGVIPGVAPGSVTARHLDRIATRLAAIAAVYVVGLCLLPSLVVRLFGLPASPLVGYPFLIVVWVAIDLRRRAGLNQAATGTGLVNPP